MIYDISIKTNILNRRSVCRKVHMILRAFSNALDAQDILEPGLFRPNLMLLISAGDGRAVNNFIDVVKSHTRSEVKCELKSSP